MGLGWRGRHEQRTKESAQRCYRRGRPRFSTHRVLTDLYSTSVGTIVALTIWVVVIPALGVLGFGAGKETDETEGSRKSSGLAILITVGVFITIFLNIS